MSKYHFTNEATEADLMISEIEAWLNEEPATYTSRTTRKVYKVDPNKGDGYWCPTHKHCTRQCDERRWGKYGAAGVLFFHRETGTFLLNQRSKAIHYGGTWSTLGGAIDRNEDAFDGAMREAEEEIGAIPAPYWQIAKQESVTQAGDDSWTYTTFVVEVTDQWEPESGDWESMDNAWVTVNDLATMKLHPGFKSSVHGLIAEMYQKGAFA